MSSNVAPDYPTRQESSATVPLGYRSAIAVLVAGRSAFFGSPDHDLPANRSVLLSGDDRTPTFGYVGTEYPRTRVLLLGINPGNGPETEVRSATDARMMPALVRFAADPTPGHFVEAMKAYKAECVTWHVWRRHCQEIIGAGRLSLEEIAYSNCLPWRSGSNSAFSDSVAERAATLYAHPLIEELAPRVVVALGKRAGAILQIGGQRLPPIIVWNRAQAATPAVGRERQQAAAEILRLVGRHD